MRILNAATITAAALRAAELDHHVAKFACVAAAIPLAAVDNQATADSGPPPNSKQ